MKINNGYFLSASLLAGAIIGAGIFSLPFVFQSAGLSAGFFYLAIAAIVYVFIHLMYADVIIRTKEDHRFVGYAKIYLGKLASQFSILMTVVEMIFVLTIYLVLSVSFSNLVSMLGGEVEKLIIFWFLGSLAIYFTLRRIALLEFLITAGIIAIIAIIFVLGFGKIFQIPSAEFLPDFSNIFLPLAPVLFAFSGRVAIPSLISYIRGLKIKEKANSAIKRTVIIGTSLPAIVYGLFVLAVITLSLVVSPDAVTGLINNVPPTVLLAVGALGILSLFSSYILVGVDINKTLSLDLKLPRWIRFLLVVGGPLLIYFAGFQSFIGLVSFVGGIFLSLEGFFIIAMWLNANKIAGAPVLLKKPSLVIILFLILVFTTALVNEVLALF